MSEMKFGERIRLVRKDAGCNQKEFCSVLDIPQSTLSAYETDRMQPTVATLINIATKFNVSMDWLCGIEKSVLPNDMPKDDYITREMYKNMYHREQIRCGGLRAMAENVIAAERKIIIDIKTTGDKPLGIKRDEILWLTIIDTDGNILYDRVLAPERKCHQDFRFWSRATGVDFELLSNAPTLRKQLYKINEILLSANTIIGYSTGKIIAFLRESGCMWRSDYDLVSLNEAFEDTIAECGEGKENAALEDCAAFWEYKWDNDGNEHSTLENCRAVLHCYNKMLESGYELTY